MGGSGMSDSIDPWIEEFAEMTRSIGRRLRGNDRRCRFKNAKG
jgi:hypothetical protein